MKNMVDLCKGLHEEPKQLLLRVRDSANELKSFLVKVNP
jgi:hypothetical protein